MYLFSPSYSNLSPTSAPQLKERAPTRIVQETHTTRRRPRHQTHENSQSPCSSPQSPKTGTPNLDPIPDRQLWNHSTLLAPKPSRYLEPPSGSSAQSSSKASPPASGHLDPSQVSLENWTPITGPLPHPRTKSGTWTLLGPLTVFPKTGKLKPLSGFS